jgi:hypothetical protein
MEAAQLESRLEEKAVAGSRSGEQGDSLIRRVLAFQEEKRIGVSPPGQPLEDPGPGQPGSNLFRVEPAEEKISGVLARQLEEEFAFRRGRAGPLPRCLKQRKGEKPAQVESTLALPFHDASSVPQGRKRRLTGARGRE